LFLNAFTNTSLGGVVLNRTCLSPIYLLTLYLSGNYSAFYIEDLRILRATIAHALFKKKNESKFNELLLKRESVVNKLVNLKETYRSRTAK